MYRDVRALRVAQVIVRALSESVAPGLEHATAARRLLSANEPILVLDAQKKKTQLAKVSDT